MRGVCSAQATAAVCSCGCTLYCSEYKTPDGTRHFYTDAAKRPFFQSSRKTAWERPLLQWLGVLLERSQVAFDGFATAYSSFLTYAELPGAGVHLGDLRPFDYRLAEAAWLQHEVLSAQGEAGLPLSKPLAVQRDALQATLDALNPQLHAGFVQRWAVEHGQRCPRPGRCLCLTFDADAKTCRDVCQCRVGNELVLQGHGMIEIGCTETPAHGSSMCKPHTLRAGMPHEVCGPCEEEGAAAEEAKPGAATKAAATGGRKAAADASAATAAKEGGESSESSESSSDESEGEEEEVEKPPPMPVEPPLADGPPLEKAAQALPELAPLVPEATLLRCSKCWRWTKKFPGSKCPGCPKKPVGANEAVAAPPPPTNEPPVIPLAELRERIVSRNGNAYSLRAISKTRAEVETGEAAGVTGSKRPPPASEEAAKRASKPHPKTHAGKKKAGEGDACEGDGGGEEINDDDDGSALRRQALPRGMYAVEEVLDCREVMGARAYLVKWLGYPLWQASWEVEDDLTPDVVDEYWARCKAESLEELQPQPRRLEATRPILRAQEMRLDPDAQLQRDLHRMRCGTFKWKQKGTPAGGYLRRTKGVLMAVRSCNLIVGYAECFGSESISQVVFFLLQLFELCPTMLDELTILCYDDMCHLKRYLELKVERGGEHANPWYVKMLGKLMCVDKLHIRGHKVLKRGKRTYCGRTCDPREEPFKSVLADQNTESSEQTFRWFSRFKVLLRPMTKGTFNFVTLRMMERHNRRVVAAAAAKEARRKQ